LTKAGEEYFKRCSQLLKEIEETEKEVIFEQKDPQGILRFTAPVDTGTYPLAPLLVKFMKRYPKIKLDLIYTDRRVDLVSEGVDIALRSGPLTSTTLKAKKIGRERFILVAAKSYLKKLPTIKTAEDLKTHRLLGFSTQKDSIDWSLSTPTGKFKIQLDPCFRTTSLSSALGMALEGAGIAQIPRFMATDAIYSGSLDHVLPDVYSERGEFALVYPEQKFLPPKVRVFIDFMSAELKSLEW
jgi:DNA-binding transcriptional LysR family regulator